MAKKRLKNIINRAGNINQTEDLVVKTETEPVQTEDDGSKYIRIPGKVVKAGKIVGGIAVGAAALIGGIAIGKARRTGDSWDDEFDQDFDELDDLSDFQAEVDRAAMTEEAVEN